eukprot:m.173458 g.173458  ORF g.173458 m.173458 type:complete len:92 (+) comp15307_c0_seq2:462-737(+)
MTSVTPISLSSAYHARAFKGELEAGDIVHFTLDNRGPRTGSREHPLCKKARWQPGKRQRLKHMLGCTRPELAMRTPAPAESHPVIGDGQRV